LGKTLENPLEGEKYKASVAKAAGDTSVNGRDSPVKLFTAYTLSVNHPYHLLS
jgi:hypothetical protein